MLLSNIFLISSKKNFIGQIGQIQTSYKSCFSIDNERILNLLIRNLVNKNVWTWQSFVEECFSTMGNNQLLFLPSDWSSFEQMDKNAISEAHWNIHSLRHSNNGNNYKQSHQNNDFEIFELLTGQGRQGCWPTSTWEWQTEWSAGLGGSVSHPI